MNSIVDGRRSARARSDMNIDGALEHADQQRLAVGVVGVDLAWPARLILAAIWSAVRSARPRCRRRARTRSYPPGRTCGEITAQRARRPSRPEPARQVDGTLAMPARDQRVQRGEWSALSGRHAAGASPSARSTRVRIAWGRSAKLVSVAGPAPSPCRQVMTAAASRPARRGRPAAAPRCGPAPRRPRPAARPRAAAAPRCAAAPAGSAGSALCGSSQASGRARRRPPRSSPGARREAAAGSGRRPRRMPAIERGPEPRPRPSSTVSAWSSRVCPSSTSASQAVGRPRRAPRSGPRAPPPPGHRPCRRATRDDLDRVEARARSRSRRPARPARPTRAAGRGRR